MRTSTSPRIAFDDLGDGDPALLFLPGWCSNRTVFRDLLPLAARHRRALALDLQGHGESEQPAGDYSTEDLVHDALEVIDQTKLATVVPVALSHAGWVAIDLRRQLGPGTCQASSCSTGWSSGPRHRSQTPWLPCRTHTVGKRCVSCCSRCGPQAWTSPPSTPTSPRCGHTDSAPGAAPVERSLTGSPPKGHPSPPWSNWRPRARRCTFTPSRATTNTSPLSKPMPPRNHGSKYSVL